MTAETVTLPVIGETKTNVLIGAGVTVAVIVGFHYVRQARNATVETAPVAEESAGTYGADIGSGSGGYYATPSAASSSVVDDGTPVISTNAQWTQAAVEALSNIGFDPQTVSTALGKYLTGSPLTTGEKTIVQTAKGMIGNEPQSAPTMTGVAPPPAPSAVGLVAPKHVTYERTGSNFIVLKWSAVPGAKSYEVDFRWPDGKGRVEPSSADLVETFVGLTPGKTYRFKVRAVNSRGVRGPWSAVEAITTKAAPRTTTTKKG